MCEDSGRLLSQTSAFRSAFKAFPITATQHWTHTTEGLFWCKVAVSGSRANWPRDTARKVLISSCLRSRTKCRARRESCLLGHSSSDRPLSKPCLLQPESHSAPRPKPPLKARCRNIPDSGAHPAVNGSTPPLPPKDSHASLCVRCVQCIFQSCRSPNSAESKPPLRLQETLTCEPLYK